MAGKDLNSAQINVLLEDRYVDYKGSAYPDVYIFGYDQEGRDKVCYLLESLREGLSKPQFTVTLVNESMTRSKISKEFCTAIQKIKTNMRIQKDTAIVFLMVMNPNIHSKHKEEEATVSRLLDVIGPEISVRCVLVLKDGTEVLHGKTLIDHYNVVVREKLCMCDLYGKLYPRIIAIDMDDKSTYTDIQQKQILSLLLASGAGFDKPVSHSDVSTWSWRTIACCGWSLAIGCVVLLVVLAVIKWFKI